MHHHHLLLLLLLLRLPKFTCGYCSAPDRLF
jgi:hypothetical protein